jgi:hypothetical protein
MEKETVIALFKVIPDIFLEALRKTIKTSLRIAGLRADIESGNYRIRNRSVNHSTTTFSIRFSRTNPFLKVS